GRFRIRTEEEEERPGLRRRRCGRGQRCGCAAPHSRPWRGRGRFVADALGGNAFSGAVHLAQSFGSSGMGGGHTVFYNMGQGVLAGPSQGLLPPGVGPVSAVDLATGAINRGLGALVASGGALTDLAGTVSTSAFTAAEYASGFGLAKVLWDAGTFM